MPIPVLLAAESQQGLGALGINLPALIFELINFGILYWLLKRYAYKPILTMLERRRKFIEDSIKQAEEANASKAQIEVERQKVLDDAKSRASQIKTDATLEAEKRKNEIISEAEATAEHIIEQAKRETERQLTEAQKNLDEKVRALVADATAAIIHEKLDDKRDIELINEALKKSGDARG